MKIKFLIIFFVVLIFSGCARLAAKSTADQSMRDITFKVQKTEGAGFLSGSLVIQPFKPGEGVEATKQTDQVSLMMVKGFTEEMDKKNSSLVVITDDNTSAAKYFIKGYIVKFERSTGFMDFATKKPNILSFEGKMTDLESGLVVVSFSASASSGEKNDFNDFAYRIGQRLASYLSGPSGESL